MKIVRLSTSKKGYGGNIYEEYIDRVFSADEDYTIDGYRFRTRSFWRIFEMPFFLLHAYRLSRNRDFILIRNFYSAFFSLWNRRRGITIVYHIDSRGSRFLIRLFQFVIEKVFFLRNDKDEPILVIAEYWRDYFVRRGYKNVHLIYCPYEMEKYEIGTEEVAAFKVKHGFDARPIVYIGNPQIKKGAALVYEALRGNDYQLVTSGVGDCEIPVKRLNLSFTEYLTLLMASDLVVTFSQFDEGWCRVAHEAMLCGTPVIGSGRGGMAELLKLGGQTICTDINSLASLVEKTLRFPPQIKQPEIRRFDIDYFEKEWKGLISRLAHG